MDRHGARVRETEYDGWGDKHGDDGYWVDLTDRTVVTDDTKPNVGTWYLLPEDFEGDLEADEVDQEAINAALERRRDYPVKSDLSLQSTGFGDRQRELSLQQQDRDTTLSEVVERHNIPEAIAPWLSKEAPTREQLVATCRAVNEHNDLSRQTEIADHIDWTRSTLATHLGKSDSLEKCITKSDGTYELTPVGKRAAEIKWKVVMEEMKWVISMAGSTPLESFAAFFEGPYHEEVKALEDTNPDGRTLRINWEDLDDYDPSLADDFLESPESLRKIASEGIRNVDDVDLLGATIRIYNLPEPRQYRVGKYRTRQLGKLLSVRGKVIDRDGVQPYAERAAFECHVCGSLVRIPQSYGDMLKPSSCPECDHGNPSFRFNRDQSVLVDLQKIVIVPPDSNLEEPPATIAFLKDDLCDMVGSSDLMTLNGIYETFDGQSEATVSTYIEALDLDITERTEIDTYGASEIQEFVIEELTEQITTVDSFAVQRADIVDAVAEQYSVRREEVENQIDALIEANEIGAEGSKLFDI
ncbi:minichromosome maintenance protein MCM [Natrialba aegyptia]|uniref:DNA helicase n=1 Tax=Natrialba aegyptia DSM 13077 TaxID=1227491 RepID=M0ANS0_9EURY|nr:minichromosome maintenance protein MCM [Natrialba aegyptia]ELY99577.1 Cdc46/Mcm family-like ATPase [Natrialba aegyptia DSM 13077]